MSNPEQAEAITEFGTPTPNPNPTQPDFTTEGTLIDVAAPDTTPIHSKSVKVTNRAETYPVKNIYAMSNQAGSFDVEIMLDESELVSGAAVWRKHSTVAVVANTLAKFSTTDLFQQMRVTYTPGAAGNVKVWGRSLP